MILDTPFTLFISPSLSYEMNDCEYSYNATTRVEEIVCRTWLVAPLMILNGVIIGAGFLEFVAAIWAVAITGTALQKDQVACTLKYLLCS